MLGLIRTMLFSLGFIIASIGSSSADTYQRTIQITNLSDKTITSFFASNIGALDWGDDLLGCSVLNPRGHLLIDTDDGSGYCMFDFRTDFSDGSSLIQHRVNVCDFGKYDIRS